jgi:threonine dehydrogenase-like Zn-dependent dehydrogenase
MLPEAELADAVVVVVGCGPVGICAITSASMWVRPGNLYAVDSVQERLDQAGRHGAIPLHLDGQGDESPQAVIRARTNGRGADAVLEVVGYVSTPASKHLGLSLTTDAPVGFVRVISLKPAYKTALSLIRPFGVISSVGVHNDPSLLSGPETYDLNLRAAWGRCPVRAEFPEALEVLRAKRALFEGVDGAGSGFVSHWMDLKDAPEVRTAAVESRDTGVQELT